MKKIAYFPTPNEIVDIMIKLSNNIHNKDLLEAGVGTGAFFYKLFDVDFKSLTGYEIDTEFSIKIKDNIKEKVNKNIIFSNKDYLSINTNKKVDLIIGNPPYITNDNLPEGTKQSIKNITGSGEGNIYYAFIMQSIDLLRNNGELIYIVPYDFFYNTYANALRTKLYSEGEFDLIIDLGDLNIFKNAAPETIIFKWTKRKKKVSNIEVFKYFSKGKYKEVVIELSNILQNKIDNKYFKNYSIPQFNKNNNIWDLSNFNTFDNNIKLSDIAKVSVGIVNGAEQFFNLSFKILETFEDFEKDKFVKKFIKSKNIHDFKIDNELNDYLFIDNNIKSEKDFIGYPNVWKYLYNNQELLSNRYISKSSNWWNYLAIRNKNTMEQHKENYKIIVPNITRKTKEWFSITNKPYYISSDSLMITSDNQEEIFFLFGLLNSEYFNLFYKEKGPKKGKRILFNQKILNEIDIPILNNNAKKCIIQDVKEMIISDIFDFTYINELIEKNCS